MMKLVKVLITIMITSTAAQADILKRDYVYDATVVSVYDGDTIRVDIDLGFNLWLHNEPIRFIGINAPELKGDSRTEGLKSKEWLAAKLPPGTKILLRTEKDAREKYGRYLGTVYLNGVNLNEELINQGLAKPY